MPTAIYARKSTEAADRQVQSLEDQIKNLRALAKREGLGAPVVYEEARSAKDPGTRPEFNRLVADVQAGRVDGILAWNMSRLARNAVDGGLVAYLLQTGRLRFIQTPERTYRPEDNALLMSVENGMSIAYLQDLSRNVRRGMRGKVERGWIPGKAPVGYRNDYETHEVVRDEERWNLVRSAWDMVLSGLSVGETHRRLVAAGLTIRSRRKAYGAISRSRVHDLLREPFYMGELVYQGERHPGRQPPMVTAAEFAEVQRRLDRPQPLRRPRLEFAFAGTLRCAACGCSVVGERKVKRYSGRAATYVYYHCSGAKGCPKNAVREEELARWARVFFRSAAIDEGFAGWMRTAAIQAAERSVVDASEGMSGLRRAMAKEETRLKGLLNMRLDGELSADEYGALKEEAETRKEAAHTRLVQVEESVGSGLARVTAAIETAAETGRVLEDGMPDPADLARLMRLSGEHLLNQGSAEWRPDPLLAKIAAFEPLRDGSQRPESGDLVPMGSVWLTLVEDLLQIGADQSPHLKFGAPAC